MIPLTEVYFHFGLALAAILGAALSLRWSSLRWLVEGIGVYLSGRYLLWRYLYTLNLTGPVETFISLSLVLAETYGILGALLLYFQTLQTRREELPPVKPGFIPSVDIFVTIYNEPTDLLFRTLVACQAIDYPAKKVFVCDDGQRDEIRRMTERLGCHYIRGPRNADAKAGNLNHALEGTDGSLILTLDVDHIPVRSFLQETVGFFQDPQVALVQTAQHFYNLDIFQTNLQIGEFASNEQDLFFHVVQPGRNRWNASFYCGSGAILRREALEGIGGFRTGTVTEDIHTSIHLHAAGYRSVYVNKDLAAGLAPEDFGSYVRQRRRWARGCFQIFFRDNPFWVRGLTWGQKICYFASLFYFLQALPRLVFLLAPLAYLLFQYFPLVAEAPDLLGYYLPHLIGSLSVLTALSRVFRRTFLADIYETVMCLPLTGTLLSVLWNPHEKEFAVTPKGLKRFSHSFRLSGVKWLILIGLLTAFGIGKGLFDLGREHAHIGPLIILMFWATYNLIVLIAAILAAHDRPQQRGMTRLVRRIPCVVENRDGNVVETTTKALSEIGMSLDLNDFSRTSREVQVLLNGPFEDTRLSGELTRLKGSRPGKDPLVGVRFKDLGEEEYQGIIRQMFSSPETWEKAHEKADSRALRLVLRIVAAALEDCSRAIIGLREERKTQESF